MRKAREIFVKVNYPKDDVDLKQIQQRKASIIINILKEEYGELLLDKFINSIKQTK